MAELTLKDGLEAMDVAAWLRRHPSFLKDFPDLAQTLVVPREHGPAASLASYQLELLRQQNRDFERRLAELVGIATDNEQLVVRVHSYTLALMRATTLGEAARIVVAGLREDFHTDQVRLLLTRTAPDLPVADWLLVEPAGIPALPVFADFFARGEPLCGRIAQDKLDALFGAAAAEVRSAALLRLDGFGLLAIGSADANRFHPGVGTLFLKLIAEAVTTALGRFLPA